MDRTQDAMDLCRAGVERKRLPDLRHRRLWLADGEKRLREVDVNGNLSRLQRQGPFVIGDRLIVALQLEKQIGEIAEKPGRIGVPRHDAAQMSEGLLEPASLRLDHAEILQGAVMVGRRIENGTVKPFRLIHLSLPLQRNCAGVGVAKCVGAGRTIGGRAGGQGKPIRGRVRSDYRNTMSRSGLK